jgi:hypothetical protein
MKRSTRQMLPALLLCAAAAFAPTQSAAEDIDIFTGASGGTGADPKILIILDNTSNWARQSQQWPGGLAQGQSEASAINTVLGAIGSDVSLGLMEFVTGGNANDTGAFIRFAVQQMTDANKTNFSTQLTTIYNNINDPDEKRNANTEYGNLMRDAYNYFTGGYSVSPSAVLATKADSNGYTTNYTRFRSPLSDANSCGRNFIIFIGNPNTNGPAGDTAANGTALTGLGGSISPQIPVPGFTSAIQTISANLNYTTQCYASLAACSTTDNASNAAACAAGAGYDSCSCSNSNTTTSLDTCLAGTRYSVTGNTITSSGTTTAPAVITSVTNTGVTSACYANAGAAAADHGGMTLPPTSVAVTGTSPNITTTTTTYSNANYAIGAVNAAASASCSATVGTPVLGSSQIATTTATTTICYGSLGTTSGASPRWGSSGDYAGLDPATTCPAPLVVTSGNSVTTTTYTCQVTGALGASCGGGKNVVTVTRSVTGSPSTVTTTPNYKFDVTQTVTASAVAVSATGATSTPTLLGNTNQCYTSTTGIPEFAASCAGYNGGCSFGTPTASAGICTSGARYMVTGNTTGTVVTPTGTFSTPNFPSNGTANADEWTRFMHQTHAKNSQSGTDTIKQSITTYTIDVFNKQQNAEETALYMSMARVGGGKYFSATNEAAIVAALKKILAEIQSVNTTFASASLPVNATNRTQNANQVFIGMFRPDPDAKARWMGNLKQYAIGRVSGDLDLVDKNGAASTNALTGFIDDCAASFWTTDSNNYWASITINPDPASNCDPALVAAAPLSSSGIYSDLPDGPTVEKGAVAEILRKGNNPAASPTWTTTARKMLTLSGSALVPFTTGASGLADDIVKFTQGIDVNNDTGLYDAGTNPYQTRPSIHGDVVHSRPLPVNYGVAGVTVYYGANDGTFRAVDAATGRERWAFVAPEHYSKLERLKTNTPGVDYKIPATAGNSPKDYFFDGSIGIYQAATDVANPPVWIYPTQRRGGRMIYAFDVTNPAVDPTLKWRRGCTSAAGGCDVGFEQMGQTWSTPNVAFINGYSTKTTKPVVVMGGGYDSCEDANNIISTGCSGTKGNAIYFIDAETGALITSFATARAVAADVNMIDIDNDGLVDYAYAADVGGNIYRIDFISSPVSKTALLPPASINNSSPVNGWFMHKAAQTNLSGQGRKFLFGPGLFPTGTSNYLAIVSGDREHPLISDYAYSIPYGNKMYVYKDDLTQAPSTAFNLDSSDMMNQTDITDATCTSTNLLTPGNTKKGWFMYLNQYGQGEQGVTAAVIVGGMVTFSTNRPLSTALSCSSRLGEARGYFVNLFNGSGAVGTANNAACGGVRSSTFAGGGLPPSPVIGIVPIDGVPTAVLIGAVQRDGSASSPIKPDKIVPPINQTRTRTYKYIKGDN